MLTSALAAIAAGADGLIIEVHPKPENSFSDGAQTIDGKHLQELMSEIDLIAQAVGRSLGKKDTIVGKGIS